MLLMLHMAGILEDESSNSAIRSTMIQFNMSSEFLTPGDLVALNKSSRMVQIAACLWELAC